MSIFYVTGIQEHQEDQLVPMNTANDANHNTHSFIPHRHFYNLPPLRQPPQGHHVNDKTNLAPKRIVLVGSKRKKPFCTQLRLVVLLLVFFVVLSSVMMGLFLWQVQKRFPSIQVKQEESSTRGCIPLPKPIPLGELPESVTDKLRRMKEFIVKNMATNKNFGALSANLVYRDQVVWHGSFGAMSKADTSKPSTSTVYPCASISKAITALIVFKLFDEGKITSLDDPVTRYDPDFKIKNPFNNHSISLRNLLSMTSGIPREAPCYPPKINNLCPYNHNTMLKRIRNVTLLVEPNTVLQYSNFGYAVLGNILAKRFTGGDFTALVKKYVLEPLQMDNTKFSMKQSQLLDVPVAYLNDGKSVGVFDWGWLNPAGGMFTTVDDLAKMVIELMTDRSKNRYLSKYTTKELLSVANVMPDGRTMSGMPWEMKITDGIVLRQKAASVFGYEAWIAMVPELKIAFNVLCSNCGGFISKLISNNFAKEIVPSLEKELRNHENQNIILPPNYEAYIGSYTTRDVPFVDSFTIAKQDNKLTLVNQGTTLFYLNYTAPGLFRFVVHSAKLRCRDVYILASENEPVVFDDISSRDGLSPGFTLYGVSPTGRSYFSRLPST